MRAQEAWSKPVTVVDRTQMGQLLGLGLRRLGNPVVWRDGQGRVHLFVVATGWGGWAASRVLHLRQREISTAFDGSAFEPVGLLPLSWLWNTSYLVRNAPMALQDGGAVLPVHFELGSKVPAAVRLRPDGGFAGVTRLSNNDYWLQPALLAPEPTRWLALMRDERHGGRIGVAQSADAGAHWADLPDLDQPNPDAAVATLQLSPQQMLLAHNPIESGRNVLALSHSSNGLQWTPVATLEQGSSEAEFSYPAMAWVDGALWVTYTVERQTLSWQKLVPTGSAVAPAASLSTTVKGVKP
jgi:predicted neuraminidase